MTRVFEHRRQWRLDQAAFDAGTELLAAAVAAHAVPDLVVGVARGGVPLAAALATLLSTPLATVAARHNPSDAHEAPAAGRVEVNDADLAGLPLVGGARVLVADDICGSGATLSTITRAIAERVHPLAFTTATLCRNEGSARRPDLWLWDVADWVVFPWETDPGPNAEPLPVPGAVRRGPR